MDSESDYQTRHMPNSNDYGEPKAAQHRRGTQAVINESWPLSDKAGGHESGIKDQPAPIDVEVRVEWADDGRSGYQEARRGGLLRTYSSGSRTHGQRRGLCGTELGT